MNVVPSTRGAAREDYEPNVRAFLPGCEGEELKLRSSLLLMRDRAMATKPICCEEAWVLLDLVERTSSAFAFRSMPLEGLRELRRLCVDVVARASSFNALFGPTLDLGKADGRG